MSREQMPQGSRRMAGLIRASRRPNTDGLDSEGVGALVYGALASAQRAKPVNHQCHPGCETCTVEKVCG